MYISNNFTWTLLRQEFEGRYTLKNGDNLVGRSPSSDLQCLSVYVSRNHCMIEVGEQIRLVDLKSANGTYVNNEKLKPNAHCVLKEDDIIGLGVDTNAERDIDKYYVYILRLIKKEVGIIEGDHDVFNDTDNTLSKRRLSEGVELNANSESSSKGIRRLLNVEIKQEPQPSTSNLFDEDVIIVSDDDDDDVLVKNMARRKSVISKPDENRVSTIKENAEKNILKQLQDDLKNTSSNLTDTCFNAPKQVHYRKISEAEKSSAEKHVATPKKRTYRSMTLVADTSKEEVGRFSKCRRKSFTNEENKNPVNKPNSKAKSKEEDKINDKTKSERCSKGEINLKKNQKNKSENSSKTVSSAGSSEKVSLENNRRGKKRKKTSDMISENKSSNELTDDLHTPQKISKRRSTYAERNILDKSLNKDKSKKNKLNNSKFSKKDMSCKTKEGHEKKRSISPNCTGDMKIDDKEIINLCTSSDEEIIKRERIMEASYTQADDDDLLFDDVELIPGLQNFVEPVNQIIPKSENEVVDDFISVDSDDEEDSWRSKLSMSIIKGEVKKEVTEEKEDDWWPLSQNLLNSIREDLGMEVNEEDFVDLASPLIDREITPEPPEIAESNRVGFSKGHIHEEDKSEKAQEIVKGDNISTASNNKRQGLSVNNKRRLSTKPILIEAQPLLPPSRRKSATPKESKTAPRAARRSRAKSLCSTSRTNRYSADIIKERKNRLKQIAEDEAARKTKEDATNKKPINNKPHVKVTEKNRSAFLADDISKKPINCNRVSSKLSEVDLFGGENNVKEIKKYKIPKKKQQNNILANKQSEDEIASVSTLNNNSKIKAIEHNVKDANAAGRKQSLAQLIINNAPPPNTRVSTLPTPETSKPLKSCLKSIKTPKTIKPRKVVINIKPTIHFIEFASDNSKLKKCTSKDAPIPVNNLSILPKSNQPSERIDNRMPWEYIIALITHWNPIWLQEQNVLSEPPPLLNSNLKLTPMLHSFSNFDDYVGILLPLLLHEFWSTIHNAWIVNTNKPSAHQKKTFHLGVDDTFEDQIVLPNKTKLLTIRGHLLLSKSESENKYHPKDGDLVVLALKVESKSKQSTDANSFRRVLAYINSQRKDFLRKNMKVHQELYNVAPHAYTILNLELKTYSKNFRIDKTQASMISVICYIRPDLRSWQAVCDLPRSPLCKYILNPKATDFPQHDIPRDIYISANNAPLNINQKKVVLETVEDLLCPPPVITMIQGPPGTGKSHVIVSIVQQLLYGTGQNKQRGKLLICAPSNAAVDEVLSRLLAVRKTIKGVKFKMLRLGVLESMSIVAKDISLQQLAKRDVQNKLANPAVGQPQMESVEMQKRVYEAKINGVNSSIQSAEEGNRDTSLLKDKKALYIERLSFLEKSHTNGIINGNIMQMERESQRILLEGADIICTTLSSCMHGQLLGSKVKFDYCIVDEATQCTEPETLMPLMLGVKKLVLVGDPQQLPATVISQVSKKYGLDSSLFARLQNCFEDTKHNPVKLLNVQYRMHPEICRWPNHYFYRNILKNFTLSKNYYCPLVPYTVMKLNFEQQNRINLVNHEEAEFVVGLTLSIVKCTVRQKYNIGIITPYQHQKQYITEQLKRYCKDLENRYVDVQTIDSCQGQERDVVLMSLVRTDGVGFLSHSNRLNVALTRAKHCLVVCGNFTSLQCRDGIMNEKCLTMKRTGYDKFQQADKMWSALLSDAERRKLLVTVSGGNTESAYQTVIKQ